jgi:phosphoglycerate dehydrogenase-like enzyme
VAAIGKAFGMECVAWSQNLTQEKAEAAGVTKVDKENLFETADVLTIHLVLSERTRGLVRAEDLALMKPGAILVNTSRGPIVVESDLLAALKKQRLHAALDVYEREPLPAEHPLRALENVTLSPHLGYVHEENYRTFYRDTVENLAAFLAGKPIRVINP